MDSENRTHDQAQRPCPHCGAIMMAAATRCGSCWVSVEPLSHSEPERTRTTVASGSVPSKSREYKVITQRDEFFRSKFNPDSLQILLNRHAEDGWYVVGITATDVGSFLGSFWGKGGGATRQELIVLLERTVPRET